MKLKTNDPARKFSVGDGKITMKDCAHIRLDPDEQVTFFTDSGAEYDVARKSWGFYATPSLNHRLRNFGLRAALIKGQNGRAYVFLIEQGKENDFESYLKSEGLVILHWLDCNEEVNALEARLKERKCEG